MVEFKKCDCGKKATWLYMPGFHDGSPFFCDDCVHRGCSCNEYSIVPEHYHPPGGFHPTEEDGVEGVDWKWKNEEKTSWSRIDEKGRYYPCCEYDYEEEGFEID
jgi:hypothetical protein